MVATILSIISIICVGISIGFTLWARHDEKKIKQSRHLVERSEKIYEKSKRNYKY